MAGLGHLLYGLCNRSRLAAEPDPRVNPHPDDGFMRQVVRTLTIADGVGCRLLICDRDAKWNEPVRARLEDAGPRAVRTPYRAPNANAYAERFVRSIKEERLDRLIPIGRAAGGTAITEYVAHYHRERNHQGIDNALIAGAAGGEGPRGRIRRRPRLGG